MQAKTMWFTCLFLALCVQSGDLMWFIGVFLTFCVQSGTYGGSLVFYVQTGNYMVHRWVSHTFLCKAGTFGVHLSVSHTFCTKRGSIWFIAVFLVLCVLNGDFWRSSVCFSNVFSKVGLLFATAVFLAHSVQSADMGHIGVFLAQCLQCGDLYM